MPPRFDRDLPNSMHQSMSHNGQMIGNGMNCANGANGGQMNGGGISNVAASLRKPLLEINGNY